jgi:hypothetical protein
MENHTKRIRKARRQGLAHKKDLAEPNPRQSVRGGGMPAVPGEKRPNARRKTLVTQRKTKRQASAARSGRRAPAPRAR